MIPFILYWEVGYKAKPGESPEEAYKEAARKGYHVVKGDKGGPTMCGVTLSTYTDYCRRKGVPRPGVEELKRLPYSHWSEILKSMFWDRCKGDLISDEWVAMAIVDWAWISGASIIRRVQRIVGADTDGIIGPKTLQAVNLRDSGGLFARIQGARRAHIEEIVKNNPAQGKFLKGWLNRIKSMEYGKFNF